MKKIMNKIEKIKKKTGAGWCRLCFEDNESFLEIELTDEKKIGVILKEIESQFGEGYGYSVADEKNNLFDFYLPYSPSDFLLDKK